MSHFKKYELAYNFLFTEKLDFLSLVMLVKMNVDFLKYLFRSVL